MAEEKKIQMLRADERVISPDLRELDVNALEAELTKRYSQNLDPTGEIYKQQLYLRKYPGTKVVVSEFGMAIEQDSFFKKAVDEAKYQAGDIGKGIKTGGIGVNSCVIS